MSASGRVPEDVGTPCGDCEFIKLITKTQGRKRTWQLWQQSLLCCDYGHVFVESQVCLELLCAETLSGCLLNSWSCRSLVLTSPGMRYAVLFSQLYFLRSSNTCCSNGNNHTSHLSPPSVPERFRRRCQKQTWGMRKTARSSESNLK